jgi:hypothetical protein
MWGYNSDKKGSTMRLLRICQALATLCWWVGFVGFAWYLLSMFQWKAGTGVIEDVTWPFVRSPAGVVQQILEEPIFRWGVSRSGHNYFPTLRYSTNTSEELAAEMIIEHPQPWLIWYYSPLNIQHWGVAMLCFIPAVGLTLLTRHLTWRQQH